MANRKPVLLINLSRVFLFIMPLSFLGSRLFGYNAWYVAFGYAVDNEGNDTHGAGAVRFDTKEEDGPLGAGGERFYNQVRCVRSIDRDDFHSD